MLQAFRLNTLQKDPTKRPFPLTFDERFEMILPENNALQDDLNDLYDFTSRKQLVIKEKKTHLMKFNFLRSSDFPP